MRRISISFNCHFLVNSHFQVKIIHDQQTLHLYITQYIIQYIFLKQFFTYYINEDIYFDIYNKKYNYLKVISCI